MQEEDGGEDGTGAREEKKEKEAEQVRFLLS